MEFSIIAALQVSIPLPVTRNRKIKKNIGQIKFLAVTIRQQIKLVLDIL